MLDMAKELFRSLVWKKLGYGIVPSIRPGLPAVIVAKHRLHVATCRPFARHDHRRAIAP
jgi:hypothetical protein